MKEENLISVIIPIYKVEGYLERCIRSVVNQTYRNLEIILVDDGSPDKCPKICDKWAKKDSRIKVIHKKNGGLSDARNTGLKIASGKYIGFVDSDDYIALDMYECLLKKIKDNNAELVICNYEKVDEKGNPLSENRSPVKEEILTREQAVNKLSERKWWYYVTVWNKLYSRKSLDGVKFPVGKLHEDQFIAHEVFGNCEKIVCTSQKKYFYVQRSNSIMSIQNAVRHLDSVEALCQRIDFLKKNDMNEYCEGVREILYQEYQGFRIQCVKFLLSRVDKKRIKEIDKMFKTHYLVEDSTAKEKIKYIFPQAYFLVCKLKNKMLIRYRMRVLKNLLCYMIGSKSKDIILLDTPTHGNLGDHAIVLAEEQFLESQGISFYEVTAEKINYQEKKYATLTPMNQIILVHGGGFLGALWPNEEERFRRILQAFNKQKIIVFPQTVTFDTETESGQKYLKESQEIYSAHPDLTIFVREKKSLEFMKKYFPTVKSILVPDIVTNLQREKKRKERNGILLCMRSDIEKSISKSDIENIVHTLKMEFSNEKIEYTDTVVKYNIPAEKRVYEVERKLEEFEKAKLIITDRLHGMIFAAITGTPCIALSNSNGKVEAVYEWIRKECNYVVFAHSASEIGSILGKIDLEKEYIFDNKKLYEAFQPLSELIKQIN